MKIARTRVVFDRQHKATRNVAATIYIEVSYNGVRNFYNTGIKVFSSQFKDGRVINCGQMAQYQERINNMRCTIENFINEKIKERETFSLENLKKFMDNRVFGAEDSFLQFMYSRIYERPIAESTRNAHISVYRTLKSWGRIKQFNDITDAISTSSLKIAEDEKNATDALV